MDSPAVSTTKGGNTALIVGLIVIAVVALGLGALVFLRAGGLQKPTPIGDIKADLRTWDGRPVTIEGTVSAPLNVLGTKAFRVSDDTGEMMVVTEKGLPTDGEQVRVDGYVKQMFKFAGLEQTIVYEPAEGATADNAPQTRGKLRRERRQARRTSR